MTDAGISMGKRMCNGFDGKQERRVSGKIHCMLCRGSGFIKPCGQCGGCGMLPGSAICWGCEGNGVEAA
jgi:RecJ-like exonuclease